MKILEEKGEKASVSGNFLLLFADLSHSIPFLLNRRWILIFFLDVNFQNSRIVYDENGVGKKKYGCNKAGNWG